MTNVSISSIISLIFLEVILSIDNLIFIATIASNIDEKYQKAVKIIGVSLAFVMRIGLLFFVNHIVKINKIIFSIGLMEFTYKKLLFMIGGLFLIYKASIETIKIIFQKNKIDHEKKPTHNLNKSNFKDFIKAILQIILIDAIFSIDAIIVAIALVSDIKIIIIAMTISMLTLLLSTDYLAKILSQYPNLKLLAMIFIVALGISFVLNAFDIYIEKSYIHSGLLFSTIFAILDIIRMKNSNSIVSKNI